MSVHTTFTVPISVVKLDFDEDDNNYLTWKQEVLATIFEQGFELDDEDSAKTPNAFITTTDSTTPPPPPPPQDREIFDEIGKKIKREGDVISSSGQKGRRQMLGPPGTLNTITPCAACKLLRRRCAQECPFSPYFSPHEPQKFASVHKVFGASNVSKMLMEVPEGQRADAANSLVYEANVRLRDPVYGCMGAISSLQQQVQSLLLELNAVRGEILKHKFRQANIMVPSSSHHHHHHHHAMLPSSEEAVSIAVPSPPPPPPPPPSSFPPPDPLLPTSTASSSSSSIIYTQHQAAPSSNYATISSDNVSYFG